VPAGAVSVIPHPSITGTFHSFSIVLRVASASGAAAHVHSSSEERSYSSGFSRYSRNIIVYIAGTPANFVIEWSSIARSMFGPSGSAWSTIDAPVARYDPIRAFSP